MIVLVIGLIRFESGKTSFMIELLNYFIEHGFDVFPYKPVAGHNGWFQYETVLNSIRLGMLIGEDAYRYMEIMGCRECLELISPLDILLVPRDPIYYRGRVRAYLDSLEDMFRQAILARISIPGAKGVITRHYLVETNYKFMLESMKRPIEELLSSIDSVVRISLDEFTKLLLSPGIYNILDSILGELVSKHQVVLVEGFNDVALPIPSASSADYVVVVAPGRAYLYHGEVFRRALSALTTIFKPLAISTQSIFRLLRNPVVSVAIPPKSLIGHGYSEAAAEIGNAIVGLS